MTMAQFQHHNYRAIFVCQSCAISSSLRVAGPFGYKLRHKHCFVDEKYPRLHGVLCGASTMLLLNKMSPTQSQNARLQRMLDGTDRKTTNVTQLYFPEQTAWGFVASWSRQQSYFYLVWFVRRVMTERAAYSSKVGSSTRLDSKRGLIVIRQRTLANQVHHLARRIVELKRCTLIYTWRGGEITQKHQF